MALPFFKKAGVRREGMVAIDLGGRTTKAIEIGRNGDRFTLRNFAVVDAPIYDQGISAELLANHIKTVCTALQPKTKSITLALDTNDSIVRHADIPAMPVHDMRQVLKVSSKVYLQQELPGHVFDCFITLPPASQKNPADKSTGPGTGKVRVLVAGAREQLVKDAEAAVKSAGFIPDFIVPGMIGPVNALELATPEVFAKEAVALIDIGFRASSICLVQEGQLVLSRVVAIGGDRLTSGLAEAMNISYAEAEGIKVGIPTEVQSSLEPLIAPLGREMRASIDCFEHQQDKTVSQVFVTGSSSRSDFIIQALKTELLVDCKRLDPAGALELALPPEKVADLENVGPQLTVAIGAAMAAY